MPRELERLPFYFLVMGLTCAVASVLFYAASARSADAARAEARRVWGRTALEFSALLTVLAFVWLTFFFVRGQYGLDYVYHNSSNDASVFYRIGSVWAGQEGSFLLWALWTAVVGVVLSRRSAGDESTAMPFFGLALSFVLLMTLLVDPFKSSGVARTDGLGLNPLLQDPWMVIHPPTLFLGYALTTAPFALAMGALVRRDYRDWIRRAAPWAILAGAVLAMALSMGGHWAYRTLGWGGFWGWDPVENGSLVPMLLAFALLHGILMQRGPTAPAQRSNLGLAIACFLSMLYAGYLTRSGVLTEFSNHSFSELPHGKWLLGGVVGFALLGGGLFTSRYRSIPSNRASERLLSREYGFYLASVVLGISAVLVALGTSAPIFTAWFGKASTVQPAFYDWTLAPVGFLIGLMLCVFPLASREGGDSERLRKALLWPAVLGLVAVTLVVWRADGLKPPQLAAAVGLSFSGVAAAVLNARVLYRLARSGGIVSAGGYLAHVGVGVLLVGTVVSAVYTRTERVRADGSEKAAAFGYRFRLLNRGEMVSRTRTVIPIWASRSGTNAAAAKEPVPSASWWQRVTGVPGLLFRPTLARDRNGNQMTSPSIHSHPTHDLYVAPVEFDPGGWESVPVKLSVGDVIQFEKLKLMLVGVDEIGEPRSPEWGIKANLLAVRGQEHAMVRPELNLTSLTGTISTLPGGARINIRQDNDFKDGVVFDLMGPNSKRIDAWAVIDVTMKPYIWLVWFGMTLTVIGGVLATIRRSRQVRRSDAEMVGSEGGVALPLPPDRSGAAGGHHDT